jgi:hypothetical protein
MHLSVKQSFATVLLEIENHDELVPHERSSITRERQLKLMATLFTAKTCLSAVAVVNGSVDTQGAAG